MFCVERYDIEDQHATTEIFPRLKTALQFAEELKTWEGLHVPLYIFAAVFNLNGIFKDTRDGLQVWNYDDYGDTVIKKN